MTRASLVALALLGCASAPAEIRPTTKAKVVPDAPKIERAAAVASAPKVDEAAIDRAVAESLGRHDVRGAVVAVVRAEGPAWIKAYGERAEGEPMTADTVFDLASLTKPMVTATAVMLLVQDKKLTLGDAVAKHLPAFGANGKSAVTVRQLLEHTSGLAAANAMSDYRGTRAEAIARVMALPIDASHPRVYSDLGYIVLGELVAKLSGEPLETFARRRIFDPLGMKSAAFSPAPSDRIAPTDRRGTVHDPRARALGGVAGHAGLFASAEDVAAYVAMLLGSRRVLTAESIAAMRDALQHSAGGFGHTGFTGTSLWIDPRGGIGVVLLTSRLYPDGKGDVTRLRSDLRDIVTTSVQTGIDVLAANGFAPLRGRRVGLVTNATGRARNGRSTIDLLRKAPDVELVALFSPEHGIRGELDAAVPDAVDAATRLPIHSLYGKNPRPTRAQLRGIDTLVFDVQDAGARFYTYITTLGYLLEAAAQHELRVVVLDRPNPVGATLVEGPLLDADRESFIGYHRIPVRHGMTVGELAKLFNTERRIGADLQVIAMHGYKRSQLFDDTGVAWVNPSPNLRSSRAALLYPGIGLLEATELSVGRGTDRPFEQIGAPWLDGDRLARTLDSQRLGVHVEAVRFVPTSNTFAKQSCSGVAFRVLDPSRFESVRLGIAVAHALRAQHPTEWKADRMITHLGNRRALDALLRGDAPDIVAATWRDDVAAFAKIRARYLLY